MNDIFEDNPLHPQPGKTLIFHDTLLENTLQSSAPTRRASTSLNNNGCKSHPDCFTCPLPDCTWKLGA